MKSIQTLFFALAVCLVATQVTYASISTGDIINEFETCIQVNENTVIVNGETIIRPNGVECGEQPTPTVTPTPTPDPSGTPTPTPVPSVTSTPTPTPTPNNNPPSGNVPSKQGHFAINVLCVPYEVHALYEAKDNDNKIQDVSVRFKYNDAEKVVKTDNLGLAQVSFPLAGENKDIKAEPDRDFPSKSLTVEIPECTGSDAGTGGQVLGASTAPATYAATGTGSTSALFATVGTILSAAGIYMKRK